VALQNGFEGLMKLFGDALLITWTQADDEIEADFNDWYNREHLDERINLPGFRRARRYRAISADIRYMSTYEALGVDAIASPAYLDLLSQQTAWSKRVMSRLVKWRRLSGRVMLDRTHGVGAALGLVSFVAASSGLAMRDWLAGSGVLDTLLASPGVLGCCVVATDAAAEARLTAGLGQPPADDIPPRWAVLVDATDPSALGGDTLAPLVTGLAPFSVGAPNTEMYQLMSVNQRLSDADAA